MCAVFVSTRIWRIPSHL